jgi:hypothetical protein
MDRERIVLIEILRILQKCQPNWRPLERHDARRARSLRLRQHGKQNGRQHR